MIYLYAASGEPLTVPRRADAFFTLARRGRLTGGRVCSRGDRRGRGVADRVPGGPAPAA
ncbi:hypothetical protein TPA0910_10510 [Streptomyces hygroscopicus subsp. sporocinereus]|uniref:Uncharacterized protein n=1 Tax=Streptomyces hygroscopicus TaxID=1912 RepID=A0ABQ3TUF5_STRHY|nr:hypothetical protein TPA0910_10510 [Streptomyces hygroscopicus]